MLHVDIFRRPIWQRLPQNPSRSLWWTNIWWCHYFLTTYPPLIKRAATENEFPFLKRELFRYRYKKEGGVKSFRNPVELFEEICKTESNCHMLPQFYKLMSICCCILVCNAECERCFSCSNRIKSKLRSRLEVSTLDKLIRVSYSKHTLKTFNFEAAIDHWLSVPHCISK